jgi:hypothetical protein
MRPANASTSEYTYATRRVRDLLDKGWQRKNIVVRVAGEIRHMRAEQAQEQK